MVSSRILWSSTATSEGGALVCKALETISCMNLKWFQQSLQPKRLQMKSNFGTPIETCFGTVSLNSIISFLKQSASLWKSLSTVKQLSRISSWISGQNYKFLLLAFLRLMTCSMTIKAWLGVISPDFPLELTGFFLGKHLIQFLVLKMKDFRNFVLDNFSILTLNKFT